jgi:hypothetical protein
MKKVIFVLLMISSLSVFGCNFGKPAYSDVQVDSKTKGEKPKAEQGAAQSPETAASPTEDPIAKAERDAGITNTPQQTPPPDKKDMPPPSFLVGGQSDIKDLPKYKKSTMINAQVGPINGVSTAMFIFESRDTVEVIGEFYEKAFKSNGWELVTKIKDPDNFEYTLRKGAQDEALVRIKKDPQVGTSFILLSRMEKPADQKVTATSQPPAPDQKR